MILTGESNVIIQIYSAVNVAISVLLVNIVPVFAIMCHILDFVRFQWTDTQVCCIKRRTVTIVKMINALCEIVHTYLLCFIIIYVLTNNIGQGISLTTFTKLYLFQVQEFKEDIFKNNLIVYNHQCIRRIWKMPYNAYNM